MGLSSTLIYTSELILCSTNYLSLVLQRAVLLYGADLPQLFSFDRTSELLTVDVAVRWNNMIFPVDEIQEGTNILNKAKKKFTWPWNILFTKW